MSTEKYHNCEEIIARVKIFLNVHTGKDLAKALGVSENAISTWKKRRTLDIGKILLKCEGINQEWLLTGKGEALKSVISNNLEETDEMIKQELIEAYRKIVERDERIFELEKLLRGKPQTSKAKKAN